MSPCDIEYCKNGLANMENTDWDIKRYRSEKLRYYNLYKVDNSRAEYVSMNISKYQRSLYAQFRLGILPLEIEVGRFRNLELGLRICKMCNLELVEDEIHFLCDCPKYSDYRENLFSIASISNPAFLNLDSLDKFVYLIANHERAVITYVYNAFRKRQGCMIYEPTH